MTNIPTQPAGASLRRAVELGIGPEAAWEAISDFGAVHTRVAPGFLTALTLEGSDRIVTFHNGSVAREVLVAVEPERRRMVYAIPEGPFRTYSAAFEVQDAGPGACRVVWTIDLVPAEMGPYVAQQMDLALPIMKRRLEDGQIRS